MTNKAFVDTSVILRLLVRDDDIQMKAAENLIRDASGRGITLYILPVTILEIVWVLERVYKFEKKAIRELVEAIINTPQLKVEMADILLSSLRIYEESNIKFADALMGCWGLGRGLRTVFTFDDKHFKRIEGLQVEKP
jgi:predicted nucleic-acid-binding protein